MAKGPKYRVRFKRHRKGRTNYYLRKKLLQSDLPRLVIRLTNKHVIIQLTIASLEGDKILVSTHSRDLNREFDWKASCGSTPSAYLTGYLAGKKINTETDISKALLDIGLHKVSYGSRIFAALKGVTDAGVEIPHSEEIFPSEERISGEHIETIANNLYDPEDKSRYKKQFSSYLKVGFDPRNYTSSFNELKKKIDNKYK
ncbi:MAG: 50S ribosomal protein L18 [Candidatus Lokiarchaeota archaeon]|nr:50S ribosomal protein L18 [Candidatus Lokiarchaeota archaeon]